MIYVVVIVSVIVLTVSYIVDEGSICSKLSLASFVAAIAFLLLRWITGFEVLVFLAKICATLIVWLTVSTILKKIF